jgi:autotransporter-associated beta strand protein
LFRLYIDGKVRVQNLAMKTLRFTSIIGRLCLISIAFLPTLATVHADSATWNLNPTNGDWNTAANWTPQTVPNGPTDVATFAGSSITDLTLSAETTEVTAIVFNPGASSFNITANPESTQTDVTLTISGTGIINNSGVTQNLAAAEASGHLGFIDFVNGASAGDGTALTAFGATTNGLYQGGFIFFYDSSTAGTASIVVGGALTGDGAFGGNLVFFNRANAGNASIVVNESEASGGEGGDVAFNDFSSAGNAVFVLNSASGPDRGAGTMLFIGNATAANAIFTLNGSTTPSGETARIDFIGIFGELCTAGNAFFTINGGQGAGTSGAIVDFDGEPGPPLNATAGTATLINNGGDGEGSLGGQTLFESYSTASQATLIANGGTNGGGGGTIAFEGAADGAEARVELFGNGRLDPMLSAFLSVGSIEGDGLIDLSVGHTQLITGANNLSTTFSGLIEGVAGSLTKIGTGNFTLAGANTYTGGTTIEDGKLVVANQSGSATGSGPVSVTRGKLGGSGIIGGATTIGTGSGTGSFLAPAAGTTVRATLTIQSALTFNADAIYTCTFKANPNRAKTDQVIANGVTINGGAMIELIGHTREALPQGLVLTLISNTSANPISGTFSNLPDGSIVTINGNNFQASYSGGDGNDLTLTVLP